MVRHAAFHGSRNTIAKWFLIISLSRDLGKMSEENTHNECKFMGHERPLGLEWLKNLHEWWVFPTNFQKSQSREWYLFHNDVFPNSCEENEWGKQSLEWGKYCQKDTNSINPTELIWKSTDDPGMKQKDSFKMEPKLRKIFALKVPFKH